MSPREAARAIATMLAKGGIDDAGFESELLVRYATGLTREQFYAGHDGDLGALDGLVARRLGREPLAYILGRREFFGREFRVDKNVLVPRPESELLVELALAEIAAGPGVAVADIGTGSGCLAVSIALSRRDGGKTVATDRSPEALRVAAGNIQLHSAPVELVRSDLAAAISATELLVANLPYIPGEVIVSLEPEVRDWEPRQALDGGMDGLGAIRRLLADCEARLRPSFVGLECDPAQATAIARMLQCGGATEIAIHRDLAGRDRVVSGRWETP